MSLALDTFAALENSQTAGSRALQTRLRSEEDAKRIHLLMSMGRIEATVKRFEHIANKDCGLRPVVEIPTMVYHHWAAKFKLKDVKAGLHFTTGYECWDPEHDFYKWWVARNQELKYREAKTTTQSSIIVPATRWSPARSGINDHKQPPTIVQPSQTGAIAPGRVAA